MRKIKKWKIIKEKDISPTPWFPLFKHKVRLPSGKIINDYYLSKLGDVVMIVPFTKNNEIVFVKQYKHGAGEIIIELPAGRIKKGNKPETEARIELEEETGGLSKSWESLGRIVLEPSKDTLRVHGFIAKNVQLREKQKLDETEDIEVVLIPASKVDKKIKSGKICGSDTIAFIKLAQLKAPELFK